MNDQTANPKGDEGVMLAIEAAFDKADELVPHELESYRQRPILSLDALAVDHDYDATFRGLLIAFEDEGFDIRRFLADETHYAGDDYARGWTSTPTPRYLDLIRAWRILLHLADPANYARDELSTLYMRYSLCPIHHIDWAICFDDEDESCAQVRAIFPHGHDT